jgi:hypothetical protein
MWGTQNPIGAALAAQGTGPVPDRYRESPGISKPMATLFWYFP